MADTHRCHHPGPPGKPSKPVVIGPLASWMAPTHQTGAPHGSLLLDPARYLGRHHLQYKSQLREMGGLPLIWVQLVPLEASAHSQEAWGCCALITLRSDSWPTLWGAQALLSGRQLQAWSPATHEGRLWVGSRGQIPGQWRGNLPARLPSTPNPADLRELQTNCCGYDNMGALRVCRKRAQGPSLTPHSPQQADKSPPT